ncbi:hypothetical protein C2S52_011171 [Perilla frutescens var. hirtella]|nr:hypothetical protein C2S52_011171 [Perilla frutescens var. hirtella]
MVAYAAVVSLLQILDDDGPPIPHDPTQLESLREQTLLDHRMIYAAPFRPYDSKLGDEEFRRIMDDISSIVREVILIKDLHIAEQDVQSPSVLFLASPSGTGKKLVVGLESDLTQIKALLVSDSSGIQIVPIVGMGGIGKTTLATQVYNDGYIVDHFYIRAWVTVSQEYSLRRVLLALLDSAEILAQNNMSEESETTLSEHLYRTLKGRRYLIVMDDMWDIEIWDAMRISFPEDNNGSRVLLTTRLTNVALYANPCSPLHEMHFLSQNDSWKLLCSNVFGEEGCPNELEGIGKKILQICGGLPLTIVVIGGVLSKLSRTTNSWRRVADNLSSILTEDEEHGMQILLLSYNHLPHHLRACFLYMGVFIGDYDIPVEKVMQLWAAEGFLRSGRGESLEELAEAYMEELVARNLILVSKRSCGGQIKTCNIHDLVRNLCVQIAKKENFFLVMKCEWDVSQEEENTRRLSIHPDLLSSHAWSTYINEKHNSSVRTVLCTGAGFTRASSIYLGYGLLRVLDLLIVKLFYFPHELIKLVHLRYLALTCFEAIPSSIFNLWNLQTLIHYNWAHPALPMEIWMMPKLRHLCVSPAYLPSPSLEILEMNCSLHDLQRLSDVRNFKCHKHILERISNLKQLEILYDDRASSTWSEYHLEALVLLQELEVLRLSFEYSSGAPEVVYPPKLVFPQKLKRLTLSGSGIPWDNMMIVGALENLEVLKLRRNACRGTEWRPIEGQFCKLKYLLLEDVDLVVWEVDGKHFPLLEHLVIRSCHDLNEIPSGIGEIPTLQMIELVNCNPSAVVSANELLEEQESMGNDDLKLHVDSRRRSTKKFYSASCTRR